MLCVSDLPLIYRVAEDELELLILGTALLRFQESATISNSQGTRHISQSFVHVSEALCQLSYMPNP